jgi:hypothetical protein
MVKGKDLITGLPKEISNSPKTDALNFA